MNVEGYIQHKKFGNRRKILYLCGMKVAVIKPKGKKWFRHYNQLPTSDGIAHRWLLMVAKDDYRESDDLFSHRFLSVWHCGKVGNCETIKFIKK